MPLRTHNTIGGYSVPDGVCVYSLTTLAPMLVCPLPSQGMEADTAICWGAKGELLAWAMLV